ncbi:MAG TPA: hypothetical protein IAC72_04610, partial [Candidatus Fimimonas merdipullorum]|nr:hypothetical protein [Candidatus Fimimonas merdipullorum]
AVTAIFCAATLLRRDKRALKIVSTVIFLCAGTLSAAYMATCAGASFDVTVPAVTESILAVSLITPLLCTLSIAYCTPAAQRTLPAAVQKTERRETHGAEERETSEESAGALAAEQSVDQQPHSVDQQPSAEECTAAQMEEQLEPNAAELQDFAEEQAAEQQSEALDEKAEKQSAPCSAEGTDGKVAPEQTQQTEDVTIAEDASTEDTEQPEEQAATEAPQENAEQPTWREVSQYVPQDQTVEGIAEEAYGSVQPISAATLKKIETLRLLLESKAITSDEYVRLVRSYIDAK